MTAFEAVLFDCDGVLVDSESITNRVLCTMLNESGWPISTEECLREFIGKTVRSQAALIEARTGKPLSDAWMAAFYERRNAALRAELVAIDGALSAVSQSHALCAGRIAAPRARTAPRWRCSWPRSAWPLFRGPRLQRP